MPEPTPIPGPNPRGQEVRGTQVSAAVRTQMALESLWNLLSEAHGKPGGEGPCLAGDGHGVGRRCEHTSHTVNLVRNDSATRGIPDSGGKHAGDA